MTRTKLVAAALALLIGGGAALVLFAGNASAADWHDYSGDLFAGHAYGLLVPKDATSLEVDYHGATGGSARITIFDPSGAKVGYYALGDSLSAASITSPKEGRYVAYVYDLTGALALRVESASAPSDAKLQQIPLKRQDVSLGAFDKPEKIDKAMTATLSAAPVFATLLYDGSAQNLDATVASGKGNVVTITKETATAFQPGVWTSYAGARTAEPANLDGVAYTVTAHADSFEGHLVLTTLAVDFATPVIKTTKAPDAPKAPDASDLTLPGSTASFALGVGKAIAFAADAGKLVLTDPKAPAKKTNSSNDSRSEYFNDVVALYAPDDTLLKVITLDSRHPTATIELETSGEYVAFVQQATNHLVLAKLLGSAQAPALRELALANESFTFASDDMLGSSPISGSSAPQDFTLGHVPVRMALQATSGMSLLAYARVFNDKGTVATWDDLASVGPLGDGWIASSYDQPQNFASGLHKFEASGMMGGQAKLVSTYYVRAAQTVVAAATPAPADPSSQPEPAPAPAPEAPQPPPPPQVPASLALPEAPVLVALPTLG